MASPKIEILGFLAAFFVGEQVRSWAPADLKLVLLTRHPAGWSEVVQVSFSYRWRWLLHSVFGYKKLNLVYF